MFWTLAVIATLMAFSVGVGITKHYWKKEVKSIEQAHQAELNKRFKEDFRAGWDAASNDYGHVYETLRRLNKEYDEKN